MAATRTILPVSTPTPTPIPAPSFNSTDTHGAAAYLSLSSETLRTWRKQKRGPAYRKLGRKVVYLRTDLDAYLEASKPASGQAEGA